MRMVSGFRRRIAPVAAVLLPAYLAACFHYVPVDAGWMPHLGTNVRATLSNPRPFDFGTLTVNDVRRVEGTVVETYPDSLGLWVTWLYPLVGEKYDANRSQFYLQRTGIAQLEQWRVSSKDTAVLLGVAAGVMVGLLAVVKFAGGGDGGIGPPPEPVATQVR